MSRGCRGKTNSVVRASELVSCFGLLAVAEPRSRGGSIMTLGLGGAAAPLRSLGGHCRLERLTLDSSQPHTFQTPMVNLAASSNHTRIIMSIHVVCAAAAAASD